MLRPVSILLAMLFVFGSGTLAAAETGKQTRVSNSDPHYTERGFFDIHVCNWPARPLFFMMLFSTTDYARLESVVVTGPDGRVVGNIAMAGFRIIERKGKPDKRVFISQVDIPPDSPNGWYSAVARFNDGGSITAQDYVVIESMQRASGMQPANGDHDVPADVLLTWDPVPGAKFYQVYIADGWEGNIIYRTRLLDKAGHKVPADVLEEGGWYKWRVHARDVNENIVLGDFNHGSLTDQIEFYTSGY